MVTRLNRLMIIIVDVLIAVIMILTFTSFSAPSANAAPLSPEFDLSRIYLKNELGHKVALEVGTGDDTLRFEGTLSKQVKLSGEEIQEIAMRVLGNMGITFLEFRTMQAEVKKSLAPPESMTTEEREQFISDLLAMLNLGDAGDVAGLFNKVASGKSEEEAIKETLIDKALETVGPIGALDAVERSWQSYDQKWQNFEYINKSKIKIDAFYDELQKEIDKYKAEKGYKGVMIFKATALRSDFKFLNNYTPDNAPLNTQLWTLELMLDQKTVTGEDTIEGALNGEVGSLAGHYGGRYKLNVYSQMKNLLSGYWGADAIPLQPQTIANLNSRMHQVAVNHISNFANGESGGWVTGGGTIRFQEDEEKRATVDWKIEGDCQAEILENGSMVFGVDEGRIESINNNFSGFIGHMAVHVGKYYDYTTFYEASIKIPVKLNAIVNQKKVYVEYLNEPYELITSISPDSIQVGAAALAALNAGGWYVAEDAWDYRIHSPWEDEQGTVQPMLLSLVEE